MIVIHSLNKTSYEKNVFQYKIYGFVDGFAHTQNPSKVKKCKLGSSIRFCTQCTKLFYNLTTILLVVRCSFIYCKIYDLVMVKKNY